MKGNTRRETELTWKILRTKVLWKTAAAKNMDPIVYSKRRRISRSNIKTRKSGSKVILVIFNSSSICKLAFNSERSRWRRRRRIMVHQLIVSLALLPTFTFTSDNSTSAESFYNSYYSHRKEITKLRVELLHFLHSSPSPQLSSK